MRRPELRDALDRARCWLDKPSEVEIPFIGRTAPSACEGALEMLDHFAALVAHHLGLIDGAFVDSAKLSTDVDALAATLDEHWQRQSLPVWLRSKDPRPELIARLEQLGDLALREHTHLASAAAEQTESKSNSTESATATHAVPDQPRQTNGQTKPKVSTAQGEASAKIGSALTTHHKYENGSCLYCEPIGVRKLGRMAEVSGSTVSKFFKEKFGGFNNYRAACRDPGTLANAIQILNGEVTPSILFKPRQTDVEAAD